MLNKLLALVAFGCVIGQAPSSDSGPLITVDFPGGTATQYVEAVRKAAKESNVVVMADLSGIAMPPAQLKGVDVGSALRVLQSLREQPGKNVKILVREDPGERIPGARAVFTLDAEVEPTGAFAGGRHHETVVFDMSEILADGPSAADVLTAVETAIVMHKADAPAAEVRFHEQTKLLIARGPVVQVQAIREVLGNLRTAAQSTRISEDKERRTRQMVEEHRTMQAQLQEALTRVAQLEAAKQLMERELEMARVELEESRQKHAEAMMQLQSAAHQLEQMRSGGKEPQ